MPVIPNSTTRRAISREVRAWAAANGSKGGSTTAARGTGYKWNSAQAREASLRGVEARQRAAAARQRVERQDRATTLMQGALAAAARKDSRK